MISLHDGEGKGQRAKKPAEQALVLEMSVAGCEPRIWRRLVVRETMWLARLHDTIQVAFDWFDYQTHAFVLEDLRLGNPSKKEGAVTEDDRDVTLADVELARRGGMVYEYHFNDGWRLDIRVVGPAPVTKGATYPQCEAGERAGPPEDCGGLEAYHDMLACIKEPTTELGREWIEWLGPEYDSEKCDVKAINAALKKLGKE